jgi:hypothetical protein
MSRNFVFHCAAVFHSSVVRGFHWSIALWTFLDIHDCQVSMNFQNSVRISVPSVSFGMTRGAQRERERARAQSRDQKHQKSDQGNANERRERDAQAVREKAARAAAAREAGAGGGP